jgi:pyruvate formate lyase activating enzyme
VSSRGSFPSRDDGYEPGRWQQLLPDGRVQCDLCPRHCRLNDGQRAFCFVRQRVGETVQLTSYGRATGFCIDPIEKKPLFHFFPGSSVLSFGTAGCNLGCKFCQNWDISKAREVERLSERASPEQVAELALEHGCQSVAFTYNDPVIFAEYVIDAARACRERGIRTVVVSAGYITEQARTEFFEFVDAANIDLKAFTEKFYQKLCFAALEPVKATLRFLRHETPVWLEVTTLLIPGQNDSTEEVDRLCDWFVRELGPEVPLHFTAFHPDYRLTDVAPTPKETPLRARAQALGHGLRHVYTGNVHDASGQSTSCVGCGSVVIERDWYAIHGYALSAGCCPKCRTPLAGRFAAEPGDPTRNQWGRRRLRVAPPA